MIGRLAGRIDWKGQGEVLIDVRGVGYVVHVSDRVMAALPPVGEAAALYTDLLVREDLLQLFGFLTLSEKEWHRLLMGVQGVGAKASMAILSALGEEGVSRAIALADWSAIARARGVGPKTAQRVVLELKDKAPSVMALAGRAAAVGPADEVIEAAAPAPRRATPRRDEGAAVRADALSALGNLGYAPSEAAAAVAEASAEAPGAPASDLIRAALRKLAPKGAT